MKPVIQPNSLYLVTDHDLLYKDATSFTDHIEQAIIGGVNVVQLREKHADTGKFIKIGTDLLKICNKHGVPLIINDRIDVALAIGAHGVHVGQDDMPCAMVRKILGDDAIIGVSVNTPEEALQAVSDGADYLGIGAVYGTNTKQLTNATLGTSGVQKILQALSTIDKSVQTVAIGGINASNIDRILFSSAHEDKKLDGIALVSAIMMSSTPRETASGLKRIMTQTAPFNQPQIPKSELNGTKLHEYIKRVRRESPLIQQMTNNVVKNFSANITIAIGASPAMSEVRDEAIDFATANGALLVNMGMVNAIETPIFATQSNNALGKPTILDPVGAGATGFRKASVKRYLDECYFDIIKGNESEVRAVAGLETTQKGVDNSNSSTIPQRAELAKSLARKLRNIIVITGVEDIVSDGRETVVIHAGHELLGQITGSGCSLGSTIASFVASHTDDKFAAVVAAITLYGLAAELAAESDAVQGPGTFIPAFIDALYKLSTDEAAFTKRFANSSRLASA